MAKQTAILSKQLIIKRIGEVLRLHKHGINWFAKCPFCNDPAQSFCITHEAEDFRCFNCSAKGTLDQFFTKFNNVAATIPTQTKIL